MILSSEFLSDLFSDMIDEGYEVKNPWISTVISRNNLNLNDAQFLNNIDVNGVITFTPFTGRGSRIHLSNISDGYLLMNRLHLSFDCPMKKSEYSVVLFDKWRNIQLSLLHGMKYLSEELDFEAVTYVGNAYNNIATDCFYHSFKVVNATKFKNIFIYLTKIIPEFFPTGYLNIYDGKIIAPFKYGDNKEFMEELGLIKEIKEVRKTGNVLEIITSFDWAEPIKK